MKISEFIAELEKIKEEFGDLKVAVSSDSEGNSYHYFGGCSVMTEDDFNGEWDEDIEVQKEGDDEPSNPITILCIYPE